MNANSSVNVLITKRDISPEEQQMHFHEGIAGTYHECSALKPIWKQRKLHNIVYHQKNIRARSCG